MSGLTFSWVVMTVRVVGHGLVVAGSLGPPVGRSVEALVVGRKELYLG